MAKKGSTKVQTRFASSKAVFLKKKEKKWAIKPIAGPHGKENSVSLGFVLRDLLCLVKNLKEAKKVLREGKIKVDGVIRKTHNFPAGLFDVVEIIDIKKAYRVLLDEKGRIFLKEIEIKGIPTKLCKIVKKSLGAKETVNLTTRDGRNFLEKKSSKKVGDSVKIELPSQKLIGHIALKKGNLAFVLGGRLAGKTAKIFEVIPGTIKRKKIIELEVGGKKFKTVEKNVFVIGENKTEIEV